MKGYDFFCGGPLSQWYQCKFTIAGRTFTSMKQYTMYEKAMLFSDVVTAEAIMSAHDSKTQKALGRRITNFDMQVWNDNAIQVVFYGSYAKYTQNRRLGVMLNNTHPNQLAEATPYDAIWGLGIDEKTARVMPEHLWPGRNQLGIILTDLREHLRNEEELLLGGDR
jgi:ribA/ribD-fused uncharacterized protein